MRNLTNYSDLYILGLMEGCNANPHKSTATIQYTVGVNKLVPVLCIYQDFSTDWNYDDRCIFCENIDFLELCDKLGTELWETKVMVEYYDKQSFQNNVNDIEYMEECEEYEMAMIEELSWYNYARMMGWE